MKTETKQTYVLSRGILTWDRGERISDRYGSIFTTIGLDEPTQYAEITNNQKIEGRLVQLTAVVLETRTSRHVGDLFHGVFPRTPNVGSVLVLGRGILSFEYGENGNTVIVLRPVDKRRAFWMDIRALYDAHQQTVEIRAELVGSKQ